MVASYCYRKSDSFHCSINQDFKNRLSGLYKTNLLRVTASAARLQLSELLID